MSVSGKRTFRRLGHGRLILLTSTYRVRAPTRVTAVNSVVIVVCKGTEIHDSDKILYEVLLVCLECSLNDERFK